MNKPTNRPKVILVADRTLSANYKILFEGIFATMQTTQVPEIAMRHFVSPRVSSDGYGRAKTSPLGLRRLQSSLLKFTNLQQQDIVCTTPEALPALLGPWVKVVGFSSSDPLGMGMSNTTTANFWKGELYTRHWTIRMLKVLLEAKIKYDFKVVAGGAGAWQFKSYGEKITQECVDIIFEGYFENIGPKLFEDIVNNGQTENYYCEKTSCVERVQPITDASMLGIVEMSRGCGRGCKFCSMAGKKMEHLPADTILSDLETNVSNGINSVVNGSEDFFRYGSNGLKPDFDKLQNLLQQIRKIEDLSFMQIDHANVTSIMQLTDEQLREIRELLTWEKRTDYLWVNMGVESANGNLVSSNCPGKVSPFRPEDWDQIVR
ncbi:MAG: radical SAM protein, partial [Planctomycetota bacterium]